MTTITKEETSTMTMEVPKDVLVAIVRVVEWRRGGDTPSDVNIMEMIEHVGVLDEWLVGLGVLEEPVYNNFVLVRTEPKLKEIA